MFACPPIPPSYLGIHGPELPGDVKITKADIGLVQNMLNWKPETRIEKWLESTIKNGTNLDLLTE